MNRLLGRSLKHDLIGFTPDDSIALFNEYWADIGCQCGFRNVRLEPVANAPIRLRIPAGSNLHLAARKLAKKAGVRPGGDSGPVSKMIAVLNLGSGRDGAGVPELAPARPG